MPCPCCKAVSPTETPQVVGSSQPIEKLRKFTAIAGKGVTAVPFSAMALKGSVPGMSPRSSSTKSPLT